MPAKPPSKYARVITWEIVPADADLNFQDCIKQVEAIKIPDCEIIGTSDVQPHVFGLSKLVMTTRMACEEDKSDDFKAAIEKLSTEDIDWSAEIVNVDFQELAPDKNWVPPPESDEEEEEEEEPAPPAKPPAKYKRVVTWEVVPADPDAKFDDVIKMVQGISIPGGGAWVGVPQVVPHVFGLSKIVITSDLFGEDGEVALTDMIMEAIAKLSTDDLDISAEVVNMDFQEIIESKKKPAGGGSELDQLKAELEAEKKKGIEKDKEIAKLKEQIAAASGGGGKKGGDKKGGDKKEAKPKEEAPAAGGLDRKTAAKCAQDGTAKAKDFKKMQAESGNKFFCAGIDAPDGNLEGLKAAAAAADKSAPEIGKLLCSHGVEALAVTLSVPAGERGTVDPNAWLEFACESIGGSKIAAKREDLPDGTICLSIAQDGSQGRFPIKMKDEVIGSGFQFLREKGLLNEDDDDEEPDMNMLGEC